MPTPSIESACPLGTARETAGIPAVYEPGIDERLVSRQRVLDALAAHGAQAVAYALEARRRINLFELDRHLAVQLNSDEAVNAEEAFTAFFGSARWERAKVKAWGECSGRDYAQGVYRAAQYICAAEAAEAAKAGACRRRPTVAANCRYGRPTPRRALEARCGLRYRCGSYPLSTLKPSIVSSIPKSLIYLRAANARLTLKPLMPAWPSSRQCPLGPQAANARLALKPPMPAWPSSPEKHPTITHIFRTGNAYQAPPPLILNKGRFHPRVPQTSLFT
jgi:hypothetical protein